MSKTAFAKEETHKRVGYVKEPNSSFKRIGKLRQGLKTTHTTSPEGRKHPPNPQSNEITFRTEEEILGKSCS